MICDHCGKELGETEIFFSWVSGSTTDVSVPYRVSLLDFYRCSSCGRQPSLHQEVLLDRGTLTVVENSLEHKGSDV